MEDPRVDLSGFEKNKDGHYILDFQQYKKLRENAGLDFYDSKTGEQIAYVYQDKKNRNIVLAAVNDSFREDPSHTQNYQMLWLR